MNFKSLLALATLSLAVSSAYSDVCKPWDNPGANKNTQWPSVSTAHYRPDLSHRVENREYDEIVSVHSGQIIGESSGRSYSNLRDMHYGNGKWCTGPVELPPITENEFGFVYCTSDDRCVIDWFICHNISQVNRDERPPQALVPPIYAEANLSPFLLASIPLPTGGNGGYESGGFSTFTNYFPSAPLGWGGFGGGGNFYCVCCEAILILTPIPEPETYLLLALGLGMIYVKVRRQSDC